MKKLGLIVAAMTVAGGAYASSLAIPWFVDNAPANDGPVSKVVSPADSKKEFGVIILKNNTAAPITCSIVYYNETGAELGPFGADNTFAIPTRSSVQFRPVAVDPAGNATPGPNIVPGADGIESDVALTIPNRPQARNFNADGSANPTGTGTGPIPFGEATADNKKNGSATVSWAGGSSDVQGFVTYYYTEERANGEKINASYGTLLPPGT